jgi:hypothetical protein
MHCIELSPILINNVNKVVDARVEIKDHSSHDPQNILEIIITHYYIITHVTAKKLHSFIVRLI